MGCLFRKTKPKTPIVVPPQPVKGNFDDAMELIFKHEGGYVNDPVDPGGETKYGISKRAYPKENIMDLTKARAKYLYHRDYWKRCSCDLLPFPIAVMLFDDAVNAGPGSAIPRLQRALRVADDGIIGPVTLEASRKKNVVFTLQTYRDFRETFYRRLRLFYRYGRGWLRRLNETYEFALKYI